MSRVHAILVRSPRCAGFTLIEVLVTLTLTSVAMSTAAALVHRALRLEVASRRVLERERALLVLGRQFRTDIHRAHAVACAGDVLPEGVVLRATTIDGGTIDYTLAADGLRRKESCGGRTTRETFAAPAATRWWAVREGRVVTLRADGTTDTAAGPTPALEVVAVVRGADGAPDAEAAP